MALLDRLSFLIDANAAGAIREFKKVGDTGVREFKKVDQAQSRLGVSGKALGVGIAAGATAAAAAIGGLALKGVQSFIDLTAQARQFQRVSGTTAEQASALASVFRRLGIDSDTGALALFRMAKNIETAHAKMAGFGVETQRDAQGNTDLFQTLLNVSEAYAGIEDPAKRAALVQTVFGRGGAALIPILSKSRDELQGLFEIASKHGEIFSKEDLEDGRNLKLQIEDLHAAFGELERELGRGLVPVLKGFAFFLENEIEGLSKLAGWVSRNVLRHHEHKAAVQETIDAIGDETAALGDEADALKTSADAFDALNSAQRRAEDATNAVQEAMDRLATDRAASNTEDVAKAERELGSARRDQQRATESLSAAQKRLNDLRNQDPAKLIADAQRAANDAAASVVNAQQDVIDSTDELNRLRDIGASPNEIARAQNKVVDATNAVADAQASAVETTDALNKARSGETLAGEIHDAERDVADATDAVTAAAQRAKDATKELNDARGKSIAKTIAKDERDLQRAIEDEAAAAQDAAEKRAIAEGRATSAVREGILTEIGTYQSYVDALGRIDPEMAAFAQHRIDELLGLLAASGKAPAPLPPGVQGPLQPGQERQQGPPAPVPPLVGPAPLPPGVQGPLLPGQERQAGPPAPTAPVQDPTPRHAQSVTINNFTGLYVDEVERKAAAAQRTRNLLRG